MSKKESNRESLFTDFDAPSYKTWYDTTVTSLKGKPFDKLIHETAEGITLQPMYRQEDAAEIAHLGSLPGAPPFVRGTTPLGYQEKPWDIAQAIPYALPEAFNRAVQDDLARGQTAVNLPLDPPTRLGLDPDQAEVGQVGYHGVSITTAADFAAALANVDLSNTPLTIQAGSAALPLTTLLAASQTDLSQLQGVIENDPIAYLLANGRFPTSLDTAYNEMAELTQWATENAPKLRTIGLNGTVYHEGGASAVQELAFTLATAVSTIRALQIRGLDINSIAAQIHFTFGLGGNFFMEVAKLRAARLLWSKIVAAFGGDEASQKLHCHVTTAQHNKTVTDAHVNMLRVTTEAFSGAVGGADSINIAPFDDVVRPPNEFSRRIARNVQLVLQEEANLASLIDPAGGSWYVEHLTDQIAQKTWGLFQKVEEMDGMTAVSLTTFCQEQLNITSQKRLAAFHKRKDVLVGTNQYANPSEELLTDPTDYEAIFEQRIASISKLTIDNCQLSIVNLKTAVSAAKSGATLNQITTALREGKDTAVSTTPITLYRPAADILQLRKTANEYAKTNGHPPQIFLANIGSLPQHKPRADFTTGFFEVGGFEMVSSEGVADVETAVSTTLAANSNAVAICGTDAAYPDFVPSFAQQLK
ncbi:MAG: methylmalonyl-CoA mutase, partial [Chloroflexi bacterium]|nr:methylmalonyl-CoA mutase [Chloroflexota bacterium]